MPKNITIQNNFTRGLITEAHGLAFPENACTETDNCVFTLTGEVARRLGIDKEVNGTKAGGSQGIPWTNNAISTFRWYNAGGDGSTELVVVQVGTNLIFYRSSSATSIAPLSDTLIGGNVSILPYLANSSPVTSAQVALSECTFSTGNGYLFVFHPNCDPFYCSYNNGTITSNVITIQIRDFLGYYPEPGNFPVNVRPPNLTIEHQYNLMNQGWTGTPAWTATETFTSGPGTNPLGNTIINSVGANGNQMGTNPVTGNASFTVATGLSISASSSVSFSWSATVQVTPSFTNINATGIGQGTVVSYTSATGALTINITHNAGFQAPSNVSMVKIFSVSWNIFPGSSENTITSFQSAAGAYPANCDLWYTFKDTTGAFNPSTTLNNSLPTTTPAPRGHFILNAFAQDQVQQSGIFGINSPFTSKRPTTGAWFQGRVWYAGVNDSNVAQADFGFYTWSENIYFSQVVPTNSTTNFGYCYQTNDPTDETLNTLLPTDGGVITIQGCGNIYKLFALQNGMLVFAQNGVWFITGNSGLGFTASDYTVTKISSVQSISPYSFVDVLGLPYFWNEEGIYRVQPVQGNIPYGHGGFTVEPITVGTILSFYNDIPKDSKIYAKGYYNPLTYVIQWVYRSTQETGIANRYLMDSVLNLSIYNKAFYTYSVASTAATPYVSNVLYVSYPNSITAPEPGFKYFALYPDTSFTFADEHDVTYKDWVSVSGQDYVSSFTTGYSLQGKGVFKHQPTYIYVFCRNTEPYAYTLSGVWDYSISQNSGRQSSTQTVINGLGQPNFGMMYRRHKIRGHGMVLQLNISSISGQPFDIMGWTILQLVDGGV